MSSEKKTVMTDESFQAENDKVLQWLYDRRYADVLRKADPDAKCSTSFDAVDLELYITSECNLKCEYCYLARYGDQLYPAELRDPEQIKANLRMLLQYFIDNNLVLTSISCFSGEIWGTTFGNEIFDILIEYTEKGLPLNYIMIPSNCSFVLEPAKIQTIEEYIDRFNAIGVDLRFSASVDGKIVEDLTRPFKAEGKEGLRSDEFYDALFDFIRRYEYGFHPMLAAYGIEHWRENLDWWLEEIHKRHMPLNSLMMLEVRNGDWPPEKIKAYIDFLDYLINRYTDDFYCGNMRLMAMNVLNLVSQNVGLHQGCYMPQLLMYQNGVPSCSITRNLHVRLGDLAIVPCHRLSYDKLVIGHYVVEDGRITGITSNNHLMALKIWMTNNKVAHQGCDSCPYNTFCMRGCFGAQLEYAGDPFTPVPAVCDLFKVKINYLIDKYESMGLFDFLRNDDWDIYDGFVDKGAARRLLYCVDALKAWRTDLNERKLAK